MTSFVDLGHTGPHCTRITVVPLSLFLYKFYLLAQATTFILKRILNRGGCAVGDDNLRQTTVAPRNSSGLA